MKLFLHSLFNLLNYMILMSIFAYLLKIDIYHLIAMMHFSKTK